MFKAGTPLAIGLLIAFLLRIMVLNAPGINVFGNEPGGLIPAEVTCSIDYSVKQYSTIPGPDLNIPMVKESEENLKEQLLKWVKHPLLVFTFCLPILPEIIYLLVLPLAGLLWRPSSRFYTSVSVLRI
jgi:hypothetical protein